MTIRVTCEKCESVLKIKDELAGTEGKCPKCKTRFVVPQPGDEREEESKSAPSDDAPARSNAPEEPLPAKKTPPIAEAKSPEKPTQEKPAPEKPAPKASRKPAEEDEFDPVSFLMDDGPKKKPAPDPEPAATRSSKGGSPASKSGGGGGGGFSLDDDDDDPDATPAPEYDKPAPTRKWGAKKDTNAASTDSSPGGSTSAAKDLLAKSMEESRVRASEMPEEEPRFNFDIKGFIREVGVKGIGTAVGIIVAVFGVYWVMNSMMGAKIKLPPLGYVSGTVTLGGKPAVGAMVRFTPLEGEIEGAKKKERARDSVGVTDAQGNFTLYYLPDVQGVKIGPCQVTIEATDPSLVIPRDYGMGSQHRVDVKSGNNPPQKIEM